MIERDDVVYGLAPVTPLMPSRARRLTIFISHPSEFLTDHVPHGDGLLAFQFIRELASRGHSLHVAVAGVSIRQPLPANIHLYDTGRSDVMSSGGRVSFMIRSRRALARVRAETSVDLVHQLNPVNTGLSLAMLGSDLPVVLGPYPGRWPVDAFPARPANGNALSSAASTLRNVANRAVAGLQQRAAAGLIVFTPASMQQIIDPAGSAPKIYTLPPGIDIDFFSPAADGGEAEPSDPVILFLANLNYRKGISTLLDAFERVAREVSGCRLSIVGSGEDEAEVARRVSGMACADRISMRGRAARDEVPTLMRSCTVYCLPSYGEPFGLTALEAMACGKPVVGTAAGGLAHLIPPDGGRAVPPRDPEALADALIEVLRSPTLRRSMGEHNRRVVESDYAWPRVGARLETIYQSVLRGVRAI